MEDLLEGVDQAVHLCDGEDIEMFVDVEHLHLVELDSVLERVDDQIHDTHVDVHWRQLAEVDLQRDLVRVIPQTYTE